MNRCRGIRSTFLICLLGCSSGAQVDEHVDLKRPEAWAMQYFTAVGLMQGNAPSSGLGAGSFALGFDVANILLTILEDSAVQSRADVRGALSRLTDYPGVTGKTSMGPEGEAEKELFLLQAMKEFRDRPGPARAGTP